MGTLATVAAVLGGGYLLLRSGVVPGISTNGQSSDKPAEGQPGYVTLGGAPAGRDYNPSPGVALTVDKLAGAGVGLAAGIGAGSSAGVLGGGALASTTALGAALPFIGIGIAAVGIVLSMIAKHHAEALANEGKVLNSALPRALNTLVLVAQAAATKEITSQQQAKALTDKTVQLYFGEVKPIIRGNWPYTDANFQAGETYRNSWKAGSVGVQHTQEAHPPDPCNAACMIAHYFIEGGARNVLEATSNIFAGRHGTLVLPEVPHYATQAGFPEIRMVY